MANCRDHHGRLSVCIYLENANNLNGLEGRGFSRASAQKQGFMIIGFESSPSTLTLVTGSWAYTAP